MKEVTVDRRVGTETLREDSVLAVLIGLEKVPLDM